VKEIAPDTARGNLYLIGSDGTMRWRKWLCSRSQQPPVLADFNGDGIPEIGYLGNGSRNEDAGLVRDSCYIVGPDGTVLSPPLLREKGVFGYGILEPGTAGDVDQRALPARRGAQ